MRGESVLLFESILSVFGYVMLKPVVLENVVLLPMTVTFEPIGVGAGVGDDVGELCVQPATESEAIMTSAMITKAFLIITRYWRRSPI